MSPRPLDKGDGVILKGLKDNEQLLQENIRYRSNNERLKNERDFYFEQARRFRILLHFSIYIFLGIFISFVLLTRE